MTTVSFIYLLTGLTAAHAVVMVAIFLGVD